MDKFLSKVPTIAEISKHQYAWVLLIIGVFAGMVSQQWIRSSAQVNKNCEQEKTLLREEIKELKADKKEQYGQIINLYDEIVKRDKRFKEVDSIAREKLGRSKIIVEKQNGHN